MLNTRPDQLQKFTPPAMLLLLVAFGLASALHVVGVGAGPAALELDPSWTAVLGWAVSQDVQFGRDIVFTYGPLGFLLPGAAFVPESYQYFLVGQLAIAGLFGLSTTRVLLGMSTGMRVAYMLLLVILAPWIHSDTVWLLYLAQLPFATSLPRLTRRTTIETCVSSRVDLAVGSALGVGAAAIALLKFSMLPLAILVVMSTFAALWISQKRREAAAIFVTFGFAVVALWLAFGQLLGSAPGYLANSLEIARGYVDAMGIIPQLRVDGLGFATMAFAGGWLAWQIVAERRNPAPGFVFFALGCVIFFAWRAGFTRADAHIHVTFPLVAAAPVLALSLVAPRRLMGSAAGVLAAVLGLTAGLYLARSEVSAAQWTAALNRLPAVIHAFMSTDNLVAHRESIASQRRAAHPITRIRERIGDGSIDVLGWEQGIAVLHSLRYRPRPVFQSYSAYTPALQRLNEAYFLGDSAPLFVLVKLQAIDDRLAGAEDSLALLAVLRRYRPVLAEDGFILFERDATAPPLPALRTPAITHEVSIGEWFDVRTAQLPQRLALDIHLNLKGKLYAFWFRTPPLGIEVETGTGEQHLFRLQPAASRVGFLLNPLLTKNTDLLSALDGRPSTRVERARIVPIHSRYSWAFEQNVGIGFAPTGWTLPELGDLAPDLRDSVAAGFSHEPEARNGLVELVVESGEPAMFMHAPAALVFAISPGTYSLHGQFGLRQAAIADPGCEGSDGLRLSLSLTDGMTEPRVVAQYDIDPRTHEEDAGPQPLSIRFQVDGTERLRLDMEAGPPGSQTVCDWGWVRGLQLIKVQGQKKAEA